MLCDQIARTSRAAAYREYVPIRAVPFNVSVLAPRVNVNVPPASTLPTRFVRVLFFLKDDLYARWRALAIPAPHEFVASYSSIGSYTSQAMQAFLRCMSPEQHFYKR